MDAIEQAIRNAFSKGDPEDRAFREKVYRSANGALEKAIQSNAAITPEMAERRRRVLLATVTSIESEFVPAVEPVSSPAPPVNQTTPPPVTPVPEVTISPPPRTEPDFFPELSADRGAPTAEAVEPVAVGEARRPQKSAAGAGASDRKSGRSWGLLAGLVMFLVIVGLAVWIAVEAGILNLSSGGGRVESSANAPSGDGAEGAPRRPGEQEALENWIILFSPDDPTTVTAAAGAQAETVDTDGEKAIRISSGTGGAPVRFDVGQGILEQIAGKAAVFDIVARTGDGPETQISVSCDFGPLGDCGRNRYIVNTQRSEFLLQVDVPAGTPSGSGVIEIQSDIENQGKSVEIIQIRVSTP